ncbi:hypothetical protein JG687_00007012, partial [Phytophthora cactorum]
TRCYCGWWGQVGGSCQAAVVAGEDEVVGRPDAAGQAVGVGADEFVVVVKILPIVDYYEGIMACILTASANAANGSTPPATAWLPRPRQHPRTAASWPPWPTRPIQHPRQQKHRPGQLQLNQQNRWPSADWRIRNFVWNPSFAMPDRALFGWIRAGITTPERRRLGPSKLHDRPGSHGGVGCGYVCVCGEGDEVQVRHGLADPHHRLWVARGSYKMAV